MHGVMGFRFVAQVGCGSAMFICRIVMPTMMMGCWRRHSVCTRRPRQRPVICPGRPAGWRKSS
eukprot:scaffold187635_cov47-Prasinocladus_malaysianus.AAC.2